MADLILGPLVDVTISKVISVTTKQLNLAVGFKQELKKFRVVLSMVRGVLQDAEEKKLTGRGNKVQEVVQLLIDSSDDQRLPVVSIVGMGGIGKPAMAKLVYNNELIEKHFHKKMWVCVSENFDEKQILAMMLKPLITNENDHVDFENQEAVVQKLKKMLEEKNYLLILDDVWNEEKPKWDNLRNCLLGIGKKGGSRVLVTTRIEKVDSIMGIGKRGGSRDKEEAMGARLSEKATIQELQLVFRETSNGSEDRCKQDEDIWEGLQPHSNLKGLTIISYCGKCCPSWMLESIPSLSLSNETKVEIKNCKNLKNIAYSSLQKLIIQGCEGLAGAEVGPGAMKSLKEVHIRSCGKLKNLSRISKLQFLETLDLEECRELRIRNDARFASTCLQELNISDRDKLMSMPGIDGLYSLKKIEIIKCEELKSMGKGFSTVTCLKDLVISCCNGLMSFPSLHGLSSLQKFAISECGVLNSPFGMLD
ncbi:hypothetical protein SLEP1_g42726 [Rubroshorea leprosula]|uniref:NB-ARC domain-containing protein n=1 Tax=Rubroshorea leprosula TaxID=152421 RepID=A0AAV5LBB4_9ROSI|nr:hypothetical protein SLEP1_g42726 [Rubroshorea leprosula]